MLNSLLTIVVTPVKWPGRVAPQRMFVIVGTATVVCSSTPFG